SLILPESLRPDRVGPKDVRHESDLFAATGEEPSGPRIQGFFGRNGHRGGPYRVGTNGFWHERTPAWRLVHRNSVRDAGKAGTADRGQRTGPAAGGVVCTH